MDLLFQADPSIEMIEKYLYAGECFLAEIEEEIAGVFVLLPNSAHEVELKNISIASKYQNQGIGKEIIKYVIRISKLEGYENLIVKTADADIDSLNFYKKLKFEEYFVVKGHFIKYYDQPITIHNKQAEDQIVLKRVL